MLKVNKFVSKQKENPNNIHIKLFHFYGSLAPQSIKIKKKHIKLILRIIFLFLCFWLNVLFILFLYHLQWSVSVKLTTDLGFGGKFCLCWRQLTEFEFLLFVCFFFQSAGQTNERIIIKNNKKNENKTTTETNNPPVLYSSNKVLWISELSWLTGGLTFSVWN